MEKMITVTREVYYNTLKLAETQLESNIYNMFQVDNDRQTSFLENKIETLSKLKNQLDNVRKEIKEYTPIFNYDDIPF